MPVLEHDGQFTMQVEDGWQAFFVDGVYELRPATGDDGAMHLSTFDREPSPAQPAEAEEMLIGLMASASPPSGTTGRVLDLDTGFRGLWPVFPLTATSRVTPSLS